MKLIITLGNPTDKYHLTRHNAGFMLADFFANKLNFEFISEKKFKAQIGKTIINNQQVLIVKPQTFMNLSGEALSLVLNFYKIDPRDILIVYDDISLELGILRFRSQGSDGGHNGIKSICQHLKSKTFDRLKIGIGPQTPFMKSEDFVLQNFTPEQLKKLKKIMQNAFDAICFYLQNDIYQTQNKINDFCLID